MRQLYAAPLVAPAGVPPPPPGRGAAGGTTRAPLCPAPPRGVSAPTAAVTLGHFGPHPTAARVDGHVQRARSLPLLPTGVLRVSHSDGHRSSHRRRHPDRRSGRLRRSRASRDAGWDQRAGQRPRRRPASLCLHRRPPHRSQRVAAAAPVLHAQQGAAAGTADDAPAAVRTAGHGALQPTRVLCRPAATGGASLCCGHCIGNAPAAASKPVPRKSAAAWLRSGVGTQRCNGSRSRPQHPAALAPHAGLPGGHGRCWPTTSELRQSPGGQPRTTGRCHAAPHLVT